MSSQQVEERNGQLVHGEQNDEMLRYQRSEVKKRVPIAFEVRRHYLNALERWDQMHMFWSVTARGHPQSPPDLDIQIPTHLWEQWSPWDELAECISREWAAEIQDLIEARTKDMEMTNECYQQLLFLSQITSSRSARMKTLCAEIQRAFFDDGGSSRLQ